MFESFDHSSRIFILPLALLIEGLCGPIFLIIFQIINHPVRALGPLIAWAERCLNHPPIARVTGLILVITVIGLSLLVGWVIEALIMTINHPGYTLAIQSIIAAIFFSQYELGYRVRRIERCLAMGDLSAAKMALRHIVGRNLDKSDSSDVARAAIESCAENFSDAIVAPALFYIIGGLPGLFAQKAINTLDSMLGHRFARLESFGWASARCDDIVHYGPARISAAILCLASIVTRNTSPWNAISTTWRDADKHQSLNAGWPEAAMAGACSIVLAGPRLYRQKLVNDPFIGKGRKVLRSTDINLSLRLYTAACVSHAGAYLIIAASWVL